MDEQIDISHKEAALVVAVCEPNEVLRGELVRLIEKEKPEARIMAFATGDELLESEADFAILFLDIHGADGLDSARELRAREQDGARSVIVFVTGYRDYMEEAFDVHAFHYLVKPVDEKKFSEVLSAAWSEAEAAKRREGRCLLVKQDGLRKKLPLRNILYLETRNKKVVIHAQNGNFEMRRTMEEMETALGDGFYRCHRCYLVNLAKIADYGAHAIHIENGERLLLAEKRYDGFVKSYLRYARDGGIVHV